MQTILVTYQEEINDQTKDQIEKFPVDNEDLVICLQAMGIKPIEAVTDGRKIIVNFIKESKTLEAYNKLQKSFAGVMQPGLLMDANLYITGRLGWKGLLTMMRSTPIQKG
jgi:hypothetical protein